jgi:hypothetical protein
LVEVLDPAPCFEEAEHLIGPLVEAAAEAHLRVHFDAIVVVG